MPTVAAEALFQPIAPDTADMPLYQAVKRSLLAAIDSGRVPAGSALPSEAGIAGQLGVSIGTLRRAVDELTAEHRLVRRQGRGTFVASDRPERWRRAFLRIEDAQGSRALPQVDWLSFVRTGAAPDAARALRLLAGDPVIELEGLLRLDNQAVAFDRVTLPAALFGSLTEQLLHDCAGNVYQLYATHFGLSARRAIERASARAADERAAQRLGLRLDAPVLHLHRVVFDSADRPIEHRVSTVDTAHHDYVNLLGPDPEAIR